MESKMLRVRTILENKRFVIRVHKNGPVSFYKKSFSIYKSKYCGSDQYCHAIQFDVLWYLSVLIIVKRIGMPDSGTLEGVQNIPY